MALVLVVFTIAFITAMAVALLDGATTELAIHRNHALGLKALYAAQAGIAKAVEQRRIKWDNNTAITGSYTAPDGTVHQYNVQFTWAYPIATATSTGTAAGYTRKIQAQMVAHDAKFGSYYSVRVIWWREVFGS